MRNQQAIVILFLIFAAVIHVRGQTGTVTKPGGCGTTLGCFSNCQGSNCSFVVSWSVTGNIAEYTLTSNVAQNSGAWIAVAFSNDTIMDTDDVMGCAADTNGAFVPFTGQNPHHRRPIMYNDTEIRLTGQRIENGLLSCTLQRPVTASTNRVAVSSPWTLLFAHGLSTVGADRQVNISYHTRANRYISLQQVRASDYLDTLAEAVPAQTTTQPPVTGTITKPSGCGTSIGCFSDCLGATCSFVVSWTTNGNNAIYTLTSNVETNPGVWIAVGFSNDTLMGDDDILVCAGDTSGRVVFFSGHNTIRGVSPTMHPDTEVTLATSRIADAVLTCVFQRPILGAANGRVNVDSSWTLLFAKGVATFNGNQTDIQSHDAKYRSSAPAKVSDRLDLGILGGPAQPTASTPLAAGSVAKPSECGRTIGCFSDCQGSTCSYFISWTYNGSNALYTLTSNMVRNTGSWMAVGFSNDTSMGDDDVLVCAGGTGGAVVFYSARNPVRATPRNYADTELTLVNGRIADNVLECTFQRPIIGSAVGRANVNESWFLLFAKGTATIAGNQAGIDYHSGNRHVSTQKVKITDNVDLGARNLDFPLVKAHGSLMIAAWIFLASVGIVLARYYKPAWKGLLCSEKIWFQLHRICMILVFCTTSAGFIIIFIEVDGYSDIQGEREFLTGHPIIGIIVMILTVLNPIMALFRPHPGTPRRPIFNWAHFFVGTSAHILGVVNIFFGVLLTRADVPYYLIYILGAYVAWQLFVELLLEVITYCGKRADRSEAYELSSDDNFKKPTAEESHNTILVKRGILVAHVLIVATFAAVLIGLLAVGKQELEN